MSLPLEYSSGEEEDTAIFVKDAFSLSSIPSAKKPRVEESVSPITTVAAPHVLSEVSSVRGYSAY